MASLSVEWSKDEFFIIVGEDSGLTLQISREEAEGLFIVLGRGLQDQDEMRKEDTDD